MTKEEFNKVYDSVCKARPNLKADKDFKVTCMEAAKAGISEGAFKIFADSLLQARNGGGVKDKGSYTYAMAFAFLVYIFSNNMDVENTTDEQYADLMRKMYIALDFVLKKLEHDYPVLDVKDADTILEATQAALEALNADFKGIIAKFDTNK